MTATEENCTAPATAPLTIDDARRRERLFVLLAALLGMVSFGVVLSAHHIADGDLWAKLAIGASVWLRGQVPDHDTLAFTPTLPKYIDHEWGAGTLFYGVLRYCGPSALMALKIALFIGAICFALRVARRAKVSWSTTLLLALPAAWTVLPGYVPTLRAHTFTFFLFAMLLLALEKIRSGERKAAFAVPALIWIWANLHGGFAAGLGTIGVYAVEAFVTRRGRATMIAVTIASFAVTFVNPYGLDFWRYLIPALLHPRPRIAEWQPLPLWEMDYYVGFRVLCVIVVASVALGWRGVQSKSWSGLAMLAITVFLGWRSRRHAPFFGLTAFAFAGPFLEATAAKCSDLVSSHFRQRFQPVACVAGLYAILAVFVAAKFLPNASWEILAPVGHDPVREADILSRAEISGNLAVPFGWGSYASWRLYPRIKISHDGRYEAAYPESTFDLNNDFFEKRGTNWDRLIRDWPVDFVMLDLQHERLRPADLQARGYGLIWLDPNISALMALPKHAALLSNVAANLPPTTINPLDATLAEHWFEQAQQSRSLGPLAGPARSPVQIPSAK